MATIHNAVKDPARHLEGVRIFLTGATGFVGKAVVEKVLRAAPSVGRMYLLIRPRAGRSADLRARDEIYDSPIFERLRGELPSGDLERLFAEKIVLIPGEMTSPRLGIAEKDQKLLCGGVDVVLHCAATVDFDESLERALDLNVLGTLRLFDLAEEWGCRSFVHVSTAYVAANQTHGDLIPELVHPLEFDPERVLALLQREPPSGRRGNPSERVWLEIMGSFPNTYTLTKAIAEALLVRRRGGEGALPSAMALAIVRPSIIGAAWREPVPGWVDVVSAAGAVFMSAALGVLTVIPGRQRGIADIIPLDLCVNHLLTAVAQTRVDALSGHAHPVRVSHSATGTFNPVRWRVLPVATVAGNDRSGPPAAKFTPGPMHFRFQGNEQLFELEWALAYTFPSWAYNKFAQFTGSAAHQRNANRLKLLVERARNTVKLFKPFTLTEFRFDTSTMQAWTALRAHTDPSDEACSAPFAVDALDIAWPQYIENFMYGLYRWVLHEDLVPVEDTEITHNDLKLTTGRLFEWDADHHTISFPGVLSDISWAYTHSRKPGYTKSGFFGRILGLTGWREGLAHEAKHVPRRREVRSVAEMARQVMKSTRVRAAIRAACIESGKSRKEMRGEARAMLDTIASTLSDEPPRYFGWMLRKVWRRLYEGIRVHEAGVEHFRELASATANSDGPPLVLLPTHRSYIDFLILSYVFFAYNLPLPHIAAGEDFLQLTGIHHLLRRSGAFFMRRKFRSDPLYAAVFSAYLQQLLLDGSTVEFFIEGTRSRSGKSLAPKLGLLEYCIEPVIDGRLKDVLVVPVSVDYERPLEVTLFSNELLGTDKEKETLSNLLKAASSLFGAQFGKISVQFAKPISIRRLCVEATEIPSTPEQLCDPPPISIVGRALGLEVVRSWRSATVCMPTHLVATLLLMYRHGITLEQLVPAVEWLRLEVQKRGGRVTCVEGEQRVVLVERALSLLDPLVRRRPNRREVIEVSTTGKDYRNTIALGYYRNKLLHLFAEEAIIACALYSASGARGASSVQQQQMQERTECSEERDVPMNHLTCDATFLHGLLNRELLLSPEYECVSEMNTGSHAPGLQSAAASVHGELEEDTHARSNTFELRSHFAICGVVEDMESNGVLRVKHGGVTSDRPTLVSLATTAEAERTFALLCALLWPFLDSYYVAACTLISLQQPGLAAEEGELKQKMTLLAEAMYHDRLLAYYESCSSDTLTNALETFAAWGVLHVGVERGPKVMGKRQTRRVVRLLSPFNDRGNPALRTLVDRIGALRRAPLGAGAVLSSRNNFSVDGASGAYGGLSEWLSAGSFADFPMLARL